MRILKDDCIKRRLTDRAQMMVAVKFLMEHGVPEDQIPVQLSRIFYVDIDELNCVLNATHVPLGPASQPAWSAVA